MLPNKPRPGLPKPGNPQSSAAGTPRPGLPMPGTRPSPFGNNTNPTVSSERVKKAAAKIEAEERGISLAKGFTHPSVLETDFAGNITEIGKLLLPSTVVASLMEYVINQCLGVIARRFNLPFAVPNVGLKNCGSYQTVLVQHIPGVQTVEQALRKGVDLHKFNCAIAFTQVLAFLFGNRDVNPKNILVATDDSSNVFAIDQGEALTLDATDINDLAREIERMSANNYFSTINPNAKEAFFAALKQIQDAFLINSENSNNSAIHLDWLREEIATHTKAFFDMAPSAEWMGKTFFVNGKLNITFSDYRTVATAISDYVIGRLQLCASPELSMSVVFAPADLSMKAAASRSAEKESASRSANRAPGKLALLDLDGLKLPDLGVMNTPNYKAALDASIPFFPNAEPPQSPMKPSMKRRPASSNNGGSTSPVKRPAITPLPRFE